MSSPLHVLRFPVCVWQIQTVLGVTSPKASGILGLQSQPTLDLLCFCSSVHFPSGNYYVGIWSRKIDKNFKGIAQQENTGQSSIHLQGLFLASSWIPSAKFVLCPSICGSGEAESSRTLRSRPACSAEKVPVQPRLPKNFVSNTPNHLLYFSWDILICCSCRVWPVGGSLGTVID